MNCENYLKLIEDFIEGELDEQTADKVSLHIFDCPACSAHFELLEREKEIYSHYLFDIEPPANLLEKFQLKLETEEKLVLAVNEGFFSKIFAFLSLNPIFAAIGVIILFAAIVGLINLKKENQTVETVAEKQSSAKEFQPVFSSTPEKKDVIVWSTPERIEKTVAKTKFENPKPEIPSKPIEIKQVEAAKKPESKPKATPQTPKVDSEEMAQFKQLQTLEIESAKQLEKVELLLRSFRNARFIEGSEIYDISYETQQARRLLQNNIALRQRAEIYGTPFTEDLLSKVEPYLLDIANLSLNPTPEQVLEIKDRVRNQNIIASLQGF